jgi:hypothetical protein
MTLNIDLIWTIVSFVLTLFVFSYLFGDNPIFRFATGILVGVSAAYFAVLIIYQVLLPRLVVPLLQGSLIALVPLFLSGLLLTKLSPRLSKIGNLPMAYLVGAGAAVTIGGAVLGTLFAQVKGAINAFAPISSAGTQNQWLLIEAGFVLLGTIASLVYFNFGTREKEGQVTKRSPLAAFFAGIGQFFIAITLGAVFAGVLTSAITALIERSGFIIQTINGFIK